MMKLYIISINEMHSTTSPVSYRWIHRTQIEMNLKTVNTYRAQLKLRFMKLIVVFPVHLFFE